MGGPCDRIRISRFSFAKFICCCRVARPEIESDAWRAVSMLASLDRVAGGVSNGPVRTCFLVVVKPRRRNGALSDVPVAACIACACIYGTAIERVVRRLSNVAPACGTYIKVASRSVALCLSPRKLERCEAWFDRLRRRALGLAFLCIGGRTDLRRVDDSRI